MLLATPGNELVRLQLPVPHQPADDLLETEAMGLRRRGLGYGIGHGFLARRRLGAAGRGKKRIAVSGL
jgi:hypothetical protein